MKSILRIITLIAFFISTTNICYAKSSFLSSFDSLQDDSYMRYNLGNEFMSGRENGTVMMSVNLWGAVVKPGIHHVPVKTDLISLLSYAGGPTDKAIVEEILIKRNTGNTQKKINIDLSQVLHSQKKYDLTLQPDDIIVIPAKEPLLSRDTIVIAGFTLTILSAVLTAVAISNQD